MSIIQWIKFHPLYSFVILFVIMWWVMGQLVARLSGWHRLGRYYRFTGKFDGKNWFMKSIGMRYGQNYLNIITIGINNSGLYLSTFPLFLPGHMPLFIPWEAIIFVKKRWMRIERECISFKQAQEIFIVLPEDIFQLIRNEKI